MKFYTAIGLSLFLHLSAAIFFFSGMSYSVKGDARKYFSQGNGMVNQQNRKNNLNHTRNDSSGLFNIITFKNETTPDSKNQNVASHNGISQNSQAGILNGLANQLIQNSPPDYPYQARKLGQSGTAVLQLTISPAGEVSNVELVSSSGFPLLDRSALEAAKNWKLFTSNELKLEHPYTIIQKINFVLNQSQ